MRALLFILRLMMKIIAAPVVLALALFTWVCFGLQIDDENYRCAGSAGAGLVHLGMLRAAVCVQLYLWPGLHSGGTAGDRGAFDLLAAKRHHPVGDRLPGQPAGPADGRCLSGEQGAGPAVCNPGRGVWLNNPQKATLLSH